MGDEVMSALGNTNLDKNNDISGIFSSAKKAKSKSSEKAQEVKPTHTRGAKYTDAEIEQLETIMIALGTDNISKAIRYCLSTTWEYEGKQLEEIAQKKKELDMKTKKE
jgi:hypothetical protein